MLAMLVNVSNGEVSPIPRKGRALAHTDCVPVIL